MASSGGRGRPARAGRVGTVQRASAYFAGSAVLFT